MNILRIKTDNNKTEIVNWCQTQADFFGWASTSSLSANVICVIFGQLDSMLMCKLSWGGAVISDPRIKAYEMELTHHSKSSAKGDWGIFMTGSEVMGWDHLKILWTPVNRYLITFKDQNAVDLYETAFSDYIKDRKDDIV